MNEKKKVAKPSEVETLQKREIKPQRMTSEEWVELYWSNLPKFCKKVQEVRKDLCNIYTREYIHAKPIDVFNLIMKKENAIEILEGKKRIEWRAYSPHYESRLMDEKVAEFKAMHSDNADILHAINEVRTPDLIRFHNYNNTWTLDVECVLVKVEQADEVTAQYYADEFNDKTLLDIVKNNKNKDRKPLFFAFELGAIVAVSGL